MQLILFITLHLFTSPPDLLGLGAEVQGRAGTGTVTAGGPESLFYNPAALEASPKAWAGVLYQYTALHSPTGTQHMDIPLYTQAGISWGTSVKGWTVAGGVVVSMPAGPISLVNFHGSREPFYPYYDNRSQRIFTAPGISVAKGSWAFGIAFDVFADLTGAIIVTEGPDRAVHQRTVQELQGAAAPIVGIHYRGRRLQAGISYRQGLSIHIEDRSVMNVVSAVMDIGVRGDALPSPPVLSYGASWMTGTSKFLLQIDEVLWSYVDPYITLDSQLPLLGILQTGRGQVLDNSVALRLGYEKRLSELQSIRAGAVYESSPVPPQTGDTNMMDGDKLAVSGGWTRRFDAYTLHLFMSLQYMIPRSDKKKIFMSQDGQTPPDGVLTDEIPDTEGNPESQGFQTSNPGYPTLDSGGFFFLMGLSVEVQP